MEQSRSGEADSHSSGQEIHRLLWYATLHYRVIKSPSLVPILNQMNPVHNFPPYFHNIHSNIILPSTSSSSKCSFPFRFRNQNIAYILIFPMRATCPFYLFFLHANNIW